MIKTITEVTCDICSKREVVGRTDTWRCIRLGNGKTIEICNKCGERPIRELVEACIRTEESITGGYTYDMLFTSLKKPPHKEWSIDCGGLYCPDEKLKKQWQAAYNWTD